MSREELFQSHAGGCKVNGISIGAFPIGVEIDGVEQMPQGTKEEEDILFAVYLAAQRYETTPDSDLLAPLLDPRDIKRITILVMRVRAAGCGGESP